MQVKDALLNFAAFPLISLLFLSSCSNSNPCSSSLGPSPFLGPSIWISVPRKGCSASKGQDEHHAWPSNWPKLAGAVCFHVQLERNFLPTVQRPRSMLSKRFTLVQKQKASEVHSLRAGKPRGCSGKLLGAGGGPPGWKDLEWTAMVHLEARDSAWGWSTQPRGLWPQRKENCPACWIDHEEDVDLSSFLKGRCDVTGGNRDGNPSPRTHRGQEPFRGLGFTSTPAPEPLHPHTSEKTPHHPPGLWRAEGHCGESKKEQATCSLNNPEALKLRYKSLPRGWLKMQDQSFHSFKKMK